MDNDIEYFKTLSYDVQLKKNETTFILCIPELSCVAEDSDIAKAYEKLERKKEEIFLEMITSDMVDAIQRPRQVILSETIFRSLYPFMVKALVVCGVIFFGTLATIYVVHDAVKVLAPTGPMGLLRHQAATVKHGLENMTEDEKKELQLKIRATLLELKPFVDEFKVLWKESPQQASSEK
jgi:hypothetical protein